MLGRAHPVIIAPVPHLNKSLARSNKNPFYQGFLTGIATINLREFFVVEKNKESLFHICLLSL